MDLHLAWQLPAGQQVAIGLDTTGVYTSGLRTLLNPSTTLQPSSLPTEYFRPLWEDHDSAEPEQRYVQVDGCDSQQGQARDCTADASVTDSVPKSERATLWNIAARVSRFLSRLRLQSTTNQECLKEHESDRPEPATEDATSGHDHLSKHIPQYILDYAPLVHLFSGEQYWPCDIAEHLEHMTPRLNFTAMQSRSDHPKLGHLDDYNKYDRGRWVYLTSNDNVEEYPDWLGGQKNIPSTPDNEDGNPNPDLGGGRSDAPAVLVVVEKGHGVVDAFWFFFYSYNLGNSVFNVRFGNHVGDWEHSAVRFRHGKPEAIFFSEHNFGSAYSYDAVEKIGKRPVVYSAVGTHAMYATPGRHPYVLPWGILHDETDRGPLWDPTLNAHTYTYDHRTDIIRTSDLTPDAPTGWFHFAGHWGDKIYPLEDKRQYRAFGQYHYVSGPLGPRFKNLGRKKICGGPDSQPCIIKHWLGGEQRAPRFEGYGEEADAYSAWTEAERTSEESGL